MECRHFQLLLLQELLFQEKCIILDGCKYDFCIFLDGLKSEICIFLDSLKMRICIILDTYSTPTPASLCANAPKLVYLHVREAAHALPLLRRGKDWKGGGAVLEPEKEAPRSKAARI